MNFWFHITFTLPINGLHTLFKEPHIIHILLKARNSIYTYYYFRFEQYPLRKAQGFLYLDTEKNHCTNLALIFLACKLSLPYHDIKKAIAGKRPHLVKKQPGKILSS